MSFSHRASLICALLVCLAPSAEAELKPEEIAVVAARGNKDSETLARYYIKQRGLPEENLCLVDMPKGEVCPRDQWTWAIRPEVRKWIDQHDPDRKLRCLTTVWGVPLKVGPASGDAELKRYQAYLEGERQTRLKLLTEIAGQLDQIAADVKVASTAPGETDKQAEGAKAGTGASSELATRQASLEAALQAAQARLARAPMGEERNIAAARLQQLATVAGGARVLLQGMETQLNKGGEQPPELRSQFDVIRGRASGLAEMKMLLDQLPADYIHDALILAALERNGGLLGAIEWLDGQIEVVKKNETGASLDSELALVMWPDDYQLLRWQPNYLRANYDNSQLREVFRTLMVARIDAPTLALAKGLVDTAIAVEKQGLHGKVYLDGRGMGSLDAPNIAPGSYEDFDRALLITAKGLTEITDLEVMLNTGPELFKAGECPDAALYCGWYSLGKYVDAFTWAPGAVAYHMASSEATTLHDPASQVWCKKLLEDGVAATVGPVYEPYLSAFPRPEEFFAMLVQGDLTLAEVYWRSQPFTSWMMTLVGDPLYRPYMNYKVVKSAEARAAAAGVSGAGAAPGAVVPATP